MRTSITIEIKNRETKISTYVDQQLIIDAFSCSSDDSIDRIDSIHFYIEATPEQFRQISEKCLALADILENKNQSKEDQAA